MLTSLTNSMKAAFNRANIGSLPSLFLQFGLGDWLRAQKTKLWATAPTTDPYGPASNVSIFLPDDAKAETVLGAYARAGTGTTGPLTVVAYSATPSAGDVAVAPDGNIIFHAADAWTSVDITYLPKEGDVAEYILPVVSGVVTLPTSIVATDILEVQRNDTSTAYEQITAPAASNSTTGTACLNLAKTEVLLDSADDATSVRVKLVQACNINRNALLEAASPVI